MQKISSSSSYDAIVIKQANSSFKSTAFQTVFSSTVLKNREKVLADKTKKLNDLQFYVNNELIDIPIRVDSKSGRVNFLKKYYRKAAYISDSSDASDDDRSQRSNSREKRITKNAITKNQKMEELKNEQAPKNFWQFAWLFNRKKEQQGVSPSPKIQQDQEEESDNNLAKIKEQVYEGQQNSKQPLFQLSLCGNFLKKKEKQTKQQILKTFYEHRIEYRQFIKDPPAFINDNNLVVRIDDSLYTWQLGIAILICKYAFGKDLSRPFIDDMIKNKFTKSKWLTYFSGSNVTKLDINEIQSTKIMNSTANSLNTKNEQEQVIIKYRKTPDSETISKMNLKYGQNRAKFVLDTGNGASEEVLLKIFLWDHHQKIIISDVDGTITKSDILGQILPNYIHEGVAKLYTEIYKRNYKIIYLTARAIGQYKQTRKFLQTVEQSNDSIKLPEGPIFMSPDGYVKSFQREVIDKTPDILKTKILASLNEIFPNSKRPIFAGFGNRQTDNIAYLRMNIPPEMIFCISQKSIITNELRKDETTTYKEMLEKVQEHFPAYLKQEFTFQQLQKQESQNKLFKSKNSSDIEDEFCQVKRKKSQSQLSQRTPKKQNHRFPNNEFHADSDSKQDENVQPFRQASRAKSVENNYNAVEMEQTINEIQKQMLLTKTLTSSDKKIQSEPGAETPQKNKKKHQ